MYNLKPNSKTHLILNRDRVEDDLIKLRNPDMKEKEYYARVFPVEYVGDFFIYLYERKVGIDVSTSLATYGVAHIRRGIVIWKYFSGIEHARDFANFLNNSSLRVTFMYTRNRNRIKKKLLEMGYLPLTSN